MTDLDFDGLVEMAEQAIRNAEDPYETYQSPRLSAEAALRAVLPHVLAVPREALEIIACKRQCLDNLMGNRDVAEAALAWIDKLTENTPLAEKDR